ncbi:MAG: site-specific integrase [Acidimicrobiales bacterium]
MRGSKRELRKGVWELRVSTGKNPVSGRYGLISKTFHGTARDADSALRDLIDQQAPAVDGVGATFGQLLDQWLEECERLDLSPTTLRTYQAQIKRTIRPRLEKVPLTALTAKHLDDLYGAMKASGKSTKTIRNHHAIISAALHQAVRWGWVKTNVAQMAKPPRVPRTQVSAPSVEVVRQVIEEAENRDPRLAPFFMLAALTGMRRGELCALRWTDLDLTLGIVEVSRSVVVVPGGLAEKSTKTDRARKVALDAVGIALLTEYRAQVDEWAKEAGAKLAKDAFVFSPFVEATTPFRPDNVTSFFIRVRDAVGAPSVRLHDLRHFTATQLIGAGVDIRTVAERLGHTDPSLTLRVYAHVIEQRDRAAAEIMGQVLNPTKKAALLAAMEPAELPAGAPAG